jgi:3-isopropylmalate/(R)-2-methylmalate dehydratase small subunit
MEAFTVQHSIVMPLNRINVNTDDIIPAQYLTTISRSGYAHALFMNWRYLGNTRQPNPEFELNMPRYQGATILLTGNNFGCGSSREHAPWALYEHGFRVIIAPGFADIFYNNCLNIGLLPVQLDTDTVQSLFENIQASEGYVLTVDLATQTVTTPAGDSLHFEIDPFRKDGLLQGLDAVGRTLQQEDKIAAYENQRRAITPWLFARSHKGSTLNRLQVSHR